MSVLSVRVVPTGLKLERLLTRRYWFGCVANTPRLAFGCRFDGFEEVALPFFAFIRDDCANSALGRDLPRGSRPGNVVWFS